MESSLMKKFTHQARQGDVLIEYVDELPKDAVQQQPQDGLIILARGEATFHHHAIDSVHAQAWKSAGDVLYLATLSAGAVVHQEHAPIPLKGKKIAKITRQKEYAPAAIRNVAD